MPETTFIYALRDPRTQEIRYIGKSDSPKQRMRSHIGNATRENNHRSHWILLLRSFNLQPLLQIVDEVIRCEWQAAEAAYILFYKEEGCNLLNGSPGGEGTGSGVDHPMFGRKHSHAIRAKWSAERSGHRNTWFGKTHSPESRDKISYTKRSNPVAISAETRAKLRTARAKRIFTPETRARISAALRGENHYLFGKKLNPEHVAKIRAASIGRKHSAESREKIGAAQRGPKNHRFGKHLSEQERKTRSIKLKGRHLTIEHRAKIKLSWQYRRSKNNKHPEGLTQGKLCPTAQK